MSSAALTAADYMRKAERVLDEARLLATGFETPDSTIKTHHSLIAEFGKKLVLGGQINAGFGRAFNKRRICGSSPITVLSRRLLPRRNGRSNRLRLLSRRSVAGSSGLSYERRAQKCGRLGGAPGRPSTSSAPLNDQTRPPRPESGLRP